MEINVKFRQHELFTNPKMKWNDKFTFQIHIYMKSQLHFYIFRNCILARFLSCSIFVRMFKNKKMGFIFPVEMHFQLSVPNYKYNFW